MSGNREPVHKPVHLAVYDTLADWETGHTTAYLARNGYEIRTVGASLAPVRSVGGTSVGPGRASLHTTTCRVPGRTTDRTPMSRPRPGHLRSAA